MSDQQREDNITKEHNYEIGKITAILDRIKTDLYGNGSEGIIKSIPRIESKINDLSNSVISHTKVISNFIEFQARYDGEATGKEKLEARLLIAQELKATQRRDKAQRIFIIIMAIIAAIGLGLTAYFGFKGRNAPEQIETTIKNEIRAQEGISKVTRSGYVKYNEQGLSDSIKIR